jgi:hypothetical protein
MYTVCTMFVQKVFRTSRVARKLKFGMCIDEVMKPNRKKSKNPIFLQGESKMKIRNWHY